MIDTEAPKRDDAPPRHSTDWLQTALFVAILTAAALLYIVRGSASNLESEPQSIFRWIEIQWRNDDFKYNWIMLILAAFVVYRKRDELRTAPKKPSALGMLVVLGSLALHVVGYHSQLPRASLVTVVGVAWGATYALWGWRFARLLLFPAGYTLLCFSSYHLTHFTWRLRLIASILSEFMLQGAGIQAVRRGTEIYSSAGGGFHFEVADACSGLRSLVVMTALAAPYAYFTLKGHWRKWSLFLLSIPLAMLANTLRIFTLALVAELIGMKLAMSIYHDFSGFLVFVIAILLLKGTASLLEADWKAKWSKLKERAFSRT